MQPSAVTCHPPSDPEPLAAPDRLRFDDIALAGWLVAAAVKHPKLYAAGDPVAPLRWPVADRDALGQLIADYHEATERTEQLRLAAAVHELFAKNESDLVDGEALADAILDEMDDPKWSICYVTGPALEVAP